VGLFGLMSYSVARRTNEIGIRMALGADRGDVVRMILRESLVLVSLGAAIGLGSALGVSRLIRSLLFGLAPHDGITIAAAVVLMLAVAALAAYLPARRASRVDPMVALRYE
jgi:ABC-type antimicrobial peptide transport system permease subunit